MPDSPEDKIRDLQADVAALRVICVLELVLVVGLIALLLK